MGAFSDSFNENFISGISANKAATVAAATADKQQRLNPESIRNFQSGLDRAISDKQLFTVKAGEQSSQFADSIGKLSTGLDTISAEYDPNSALNKGKLFTTHELKFAGILNPKTAINGLLWAKENAEKLTGDFWSNRAKDAAGFYTSKADPNAIAAYGKLNNNEPLSTEEQALLDARPEVDSVYDFAKGGYVKQLNSMTNKELLDAATDYHNLAGVAPEMLHKITEAITPSQAHFNPVVPQAKNTADDMLVSAGKGALALPGAAAGLADIAPALIAGQRPFTQMADSIADKTGIAPGKWSSALDAVHSDQYASDAAQIGKTWADPNSSAGSIAQAYLRRPDYILNQLAESAPGMAAGGVVSRGLMAAAPAAVAGTETAAAIAGGLGEGVVQAGQQMAESKGTDQRKNAIAALGSGLIDAVIGAGAGKVAQSLGLETAETLMAKGINDAVKKELSLGRKVAGGALSEGILQELPQSAQEAVWSNYAEGKPLWEGVPRQAVEGMISGFAMGAGANVAPVVAAGAGVTAAAADAVSNGAINAGSAAMNAIKESSIPVTEERTKTEEVHKGTAGLAYDDKLNAAVESGDIKDYTDTAHEAYNPLLAVHALANINAKEDTSYEDKAQNLEQAMGIASDFYGQAKDRLQRRKALEEKQSSEELSIDEKGQLRDLIKLAPGDNSYLTQLNNKIASMNKIGGADSLAILDKLDEARAADDPSKAHEILRDIFGSNAGIDVSGIAPKLEELRNHAQTSPEAKQLIDSMLDYSRTKQQWEANQSSGKSTDEVNHDIINGDPRAGGFMGINAHTKNIALGLEKGNVVFAQTALSKLTRFAQERRVRATTLQNVTDAVAANPDDPQISAEDQQNLALLNSQRATPFVINARSAGSAKWQQTLRNMQSEATALEKAVEVGKNTFALFGKAAPVAETTPKTAQEASPAVEPAKGSIHESNMQKDLSGQTVAQLEHTIAGKQAKHDATQNPVLKAQLAKELVKWQEALALKKAEAPSATEVKQSTAQPAADTVTPTSEENSAQPKVMSHEAPVGETQSAVPVTGETKMESDKAAPEEKGSHPEKQTQKESSHGLWQEEKEEINGTLNAGITKSDSTQETPKENYTTVNMVKEFFEPKLSRRLNVLLSLDNVFSAIKAAVAAKSVGALFKDYTATPEFDQDALNLLGSMGKFGSVFNKAVDSIFQQQKANKTDGTFRYRFKDPVQYLADENGQLPELVKDAIAAVAYKWLATRGKESLYNDHAAIRGILGLKEEDALPAEAVSLLRKVGLHQDLLAEQLGREVYRLLDIKPMKGAPADMELRLQYALGLQTIATLQGEGFLAQSQVYTGRSSNEATDLRSKPYGLEALKNKAKSDVGMEEGQPEATMLFRSPEGDFSKGANGKAVATGRIITNFYRLVPDAVSDANGHDQPTAMVRDAAQLWKQSKNTWDKLFSADPEEKARTYSWEKFRDKQIKIEGTNQLATKAQSKNVLNNSNMGWVESANTMNAFLLFDRDGKLDIAGRKDKMSEHIDNRDSVEDTNLGYERSLDHIAAWHIDATQEGRTRQTPFYIPVKIDNNMRMRQVGTINPQNDKVVRYLFGVPEWQTTFKLDGAAMDQMFHLAVGLSLDIEASKEGGLEAALQATTKTLGKEEVAAAVEALRRVLPTLEGKDMLDPATVAELQKEHANDMKTIIAGVQAGGKKVASFKGLVEYARFLNAKEKGEAKFTTDIAYEIDGMTNGPVLGFIQMNPNLDANSFAILRNGGATFSDSQKDVGEHLATKGQMDLYTRAGMAWNEAIEATEHKLLVKLNKSGMSNSRWSLTLKQQAARLTAAKRLFGEFNDEDGFVKKTLRSTVKNPVMTTGYGAGKLSLLNGLSRKLSEGVIRDHLKKISKMAKPGEMLTQEKHDEIALRLNQLVKNVQVVANLPLNAPAKHNLQVPATFVTKGNKFDPESILSIRVPAETAAALHRYVIKGHGHALVAAISTIFGAATESRSSFNKGFGLATALYNVARSNLVAQIRQELIDRGELPIVLMKDGVNHYADLSNEEYAAIDEHLQKLYPTLTTPFDGGRMDIRKDTNAKEYSLENQIEQKYNPGKAGKMEHKTGYIRQTTMLPDPGVSPIVKSIQMLDATISNLTQGRNIALLNVHDGFYTGIGQVAQLNQALNENMFETMREYDLGQNMHDSVKASVQAFKELRQTKEASTGAWDEPILAMLQDFRVIDKDHDFTKADDAIAQVLADMQAQAKVFTANKKVILNHMKNLNHYYFPSVGYTVAKEYRGTRDGELQKILDNLDETTTAETATRAANLIATQIANDELVRASFKAFNNDHSPGSALASEWMPDKRPGYVSEDSSVEGTAVKAKFSSPDARVTMDEADYDLPIQIDAQNAVDTYHQIKDIGSVTDNAAHDSHLTHILQDIVSKVMNPANLFLKIDSMRETAGVINTRTNKIYMSIQQATANASGLLSQGIRMSAGEVYVHELVHAITQHGLEANPRLRRQVQLLYDLAKKTLNSNGEGYKHFLSDPNLNVADPANTFEVDAAKARWDYVFEKPRVIAVTKTDSYTGLTSMRKYSQHLDEFMAHGLSNEHFIKALAQISMESYKGKIFSGESWKGLLGSNIQTTLLNIWNRITDLFMHNFSAQQVADNMAGELENLALRLSAIDSKNKTVAAQILSQFDSKYRQFATLVNNQVSNAFHQLDLRLDVSRRVQGINHAISNSNSAFGQQLRDMRARIDGMHYGILQSMATEIKQLTPRVSKLHQLLHTRGIVIDQAREKATMKVKDALANVWARKLEASEKVALFKAGIKTDLAALRNNFSMAQIQAMVEHRTVLEGRIADIHDQLHADPVFQPYAHYYEKAARSLGHIMVHGRGLEEVTLLNAQLIAGLYNTRHANKLDMTDIIRATDLVDQLASMYALSFVSGEHLSGLNALMVEDLTAVESVLELHQQLMDDAHTTLFNGNPFKIMKGYTKEILNPQVSVRIAPLSEEAQLKEAGYTRSAERLPWDKSDPTRNDPLYFYTSRSGQTNNLLSGLFSYTGNRAKGSNLIQQALNQGRNRVSGIMDNNEVIMEKEQKLDDMFSTPMAPYDPNMAKSFMIPQVDNDGNIIKYRYMMSESVKDGLFEKHNAYDDVLGAMAGTVEDKIGTTFINEKAVRALKDLYDQEFEERSAKYVEISPYALEQRHRDIYFMLPKKTQQQIQAVWGDKRMYVAKDVVDLAFGIRKKSLLDAFAKTPADRTMFEKALVSFAKQLLGDNYVTKAATIDDVWRNLVKVAKNNMIVKSFKVTFDNYLSNINYCRARGVGWSNIIRWSKEANGAIQYQADEKAVALARQELSVIRGLATSPQMTQAVINRRVRELEHQIRKHENSMALNPVAGLMEAGVMQSIVDDVETGGVQSPHPGMLEKLGTAIGDKITDTLGDGPVARAAVNVGKVMLLTEDTQAYKVLNNAVKMTDFIGRYIMYQHYTTVEGMAHDEAVESIMAEFVNFQLPTHPTIQALNDYGLLWFSKYAMRILKPVANTIKEKPFEALMAFSMAHTLGISSVFDTIPFITKNPLMLISNPLSAFISSSDDGITISAAETVLGALK